MIVPKTYIMAMEVGSDPTEEIELVRFLSGKHARMMHGGEYNEYVFYTAELTDEEFIYGALKFGPAIKFLEQKNESMHDIIVRIFNAGHNSKISS